MDQSLPVVAVAATLGVVAIIVGNLLHYQSIKAGRGLSRSGTRMVLSVLGVFQLLFACAYVLAVVRVGAWLWLPLALPFVAVGLAFIAAAIRPGFSIEVLGVRVFGLDFSGAPAGAGLRRTGIRIVVLAMGGGFLFVAVVFAALGANQAGLWPLLVVAVPIAAAGLAFVVAALRHR